MSRNVLLQLYMMRLQLEDYVYVSAPCPRKDILVMEAVQQSFTRWTPEMVKLYEG